MEEAPVLGSELQAPPSEPQNQLAEIERAPLPPLPRSRPLLTKLMEDAQRGEERFDSATRFLPGTKPLNLNPAKFLEFPMLHPEWRRLSTPGAVKMHASQEFVEHSPYVRALSEGLPFEGPPRRAHGHEKAKREALAQ